MLNFRNFDLTEYNSYRLKSICSNAIFPENENDFIEIYKNGKHNKIILGNGNNIILSKKYYQEEFVILNGCFDKIEINGLEIEAEAGATMLQVSEIALNYSLSGLETFYDIPSSVGGAVVMNAGSNGVEIKDLIVKVRYLDLTDLKIKEIKNKEINFEYRNSFFQKNTDKIVLKIWFMLKKGNHEEIKNVMERIKSKRLEKQPRDYPNCGSVFKRPKNFFVGSILDKLGLKGLTKGGAQVSKKHSGFIVNIGGATGKDILQLIDIIKQEVKNNYNINLDVEQRVI